MYMEENIKDGVIPLGLCKQAVMKLDSFLTDITEIMGDPDLSPEQLETFNTIKETANLMIANIVNIVASEMDEEEFMGVNVEMDKFESYPDNNEIEDEDILNTNIDSDE